MLQGKYLACQQARAAAAGSRSASASSLTVISSVSVPCSRARQAGHHLGQTGRLPLARQCSWRVNHGFGAQFVQEHRLGIQRKGAGVGQGLWRVNSGVAAGRAGAMSVPAVASAGILLTGTLSAVSPGVDSFSWVSVTPEVPGASLVSAGAVPEASAVSLAAVSVAYAGAVRAPRVRVRARTMDRSFAFVIKSPQLSGAAC